MKLFSLIAYQVNNELSKIHNGSTAQTTLHGRGELSFFCGNSQFDFLSSPKTLNEKNVYALRKVLELACKNGCGKMVGKADLKFLGG